MGDEVLFYETKESGPTHPKGRGQIVKVGRVVSEIEQANPKSHERAWQIRCDIDRDKIDKSVNASDIRHLTKHSILTGSDGLFPLSEDEMASLKGRL